MTPVRATVRLQLHAGFTLADAARQVDYYAALGISHLYLSPIWRAVSGSTHGYDVVDPTEVNPELGGEAALRALSATARAHGMGLVLDIVPNHMAAHADNRWWWDVLLHGQRSGCAHWFDIQWNAPLAEGRVQLPVLDRPLQDAMSDGVLQVDRDGDGEAPTLLHHDSRLPLAGAGAPDAASAGVPELLDAQAYRPIWWRLGDDRINYRRFFTISSLAGLQVQHDDVFETVHRLPLALLAEGVADGLRVDHVDGLADPQAYLQRLRGAMDAACAGREHPPLLWVEKILAPDEELPPEWMCDGTTGYDFMDQVSAWLHQPTGEAALAAHWQARSGRPASFAIEERLARQEVLERGLRSEFDAVLRHLLGMERDTVAADARWGRTVMARALAALLVRFPVYRSYATDHGCSEGDHAWWSEVLEGVVREERPDTALAAQWIAARFWAEAADPARDALRVRFQQLSAPLNAKAVEDRAFYRYGVLLSRNEVGSRPDQFALSTRALHTRALMRAHRHPQAMLATATHDHKRGEDSRARLAVLSEHPQWWTRQTRTLERTAKRIGLRLPPAPVAQMLWQTLVGAWPVQGLAEPVAFSARILQWQVKAMREGDLWSSWTDPDAGFEARLEAFTHDLLSHRAAAPVRRVLEQSVLHIAAAGARNGLAQLALRLTLPGVPDLYQGTEGWDLSLVDPDNRRPVDYAQRRGWLADPRSWPQLLAQWQDGAVKARLLRRLLEARRQQPALFRDGDYQPLHADREVPMLAFVRSGAGARLLVTVAHHTGAEPARVGAALGDAHWRGAALSVPPGRYRNLLTGAEFTSDGAPTRLRQLFNGSPVAIYSTW
ncbi:malto-oligosyltrehalose synthase [Stenotrophomonas aracearum]|jgi:(1->4)-alpha-D-glucan 1-alpha-D-glucosylmutase|uniref:Malto-oligosyltrehalose synthase n=1 Tax=Stenotrophomonas aracearum TaxID=3003272 RepID=A0ABY9Y8D4_9GAMM|nr:malto-oligosyltrehalose synthase [Stenotrophomonas sp. A5588]WNH47119.1 malto-oligosyltrehalose synthase [Stenotrophomonas sp. A5588]